MAVLVEGTFPIVDGVVTAFDSIDKMKLASYGLALVHKTGTEGIFRRLFLEGERKYI